MWRLPLVSDVSLTLAAGDVTREGRRGRPIPARYFTAYSRRFGPPLHACRLSAASLMKFFSLAAASAAEEEILYRQKRTYVASELVSFCRFLPVSEKSN